MELFKIIIIIAAGDLKMRDRLKYKEYCKKKNYVDNVGLLQNTFLINI